MAAVSIPPSSHPLVDMSVRRPPLSSIPNAANSPRLRGVDGVSAALPGVTTKRPLSQSHAQQDTAVSAQFPPAKRAMLSRDHVYTTSLSRQQNNATQDADARIFTRRTRNSQMTNLGRKLFGAREAHENVGNDNHHVIMKPSAEEEAVTNERLENVRQWQKHYRKAFPDYVFYFDSVPYEIRYKCSKQLEALGATEVKFFSREVTHVITTRQIPTEQEILALANLRRKNAKTVNPTPIERHPKANAAALSTQLMPPQDQPSLDLSLGRKTPISGSAKTQAVSLDVLVKAKEMHMKIWALEKFQRMMVTMFDLDTGLQPPQLLVNTRGQMARALPAATGKLANIQNQLSHLLHHERRNGPSDRDPTVATMELVPFKGYYVYVRDIDEKIRPILMREYPKVTRREDGAWPQFRSVHEGRCPFIDDSILERRDEDKHKVRVNDSRPVKVEGENGKAVFAPARYQTEAVVAAPQGLPRPNALAPYRDGIGARSSVAPSGAETDVDSESVHHQHSHEQIHTMKAPDHPGISAAGAGLAEISGKAPRPHLLGMQAIEGGACFVGGEPMASGVQPSNVTSAIRSQMISSTAAGPGAKAGTNKEVYSLQRKILEKAGGGPSTANLTPAPLFAGTTRAGKGGSAAIGVTALTAAADAPSTTMTTRGAKTRAQQNLMLVQETAAVRAPPPPLIPDRHSARHARASQTVAPPKAAPAEKEKEKENKPGYCENCRDKFDDFDEHIASRTHRKFALDDKNWVQLDKLLAKLHREELEYDYSSEE